MTEKKKMGRPTDSRKAFEVKARIDEPLYNSLEEYARQNKLNRAEVIRQALEQLLKK